MTSATFVTPSVRRRRGAVLTALVYGVLLVLWGMWELRPAASR